MKKAFLFIITVLLFGSCNKQKIENHADIAMQDFVIDISNYSKNIHPSFIIIPQNGLELAYRNTNMEEGVRQDYIDAIDGFGVEELFFNGSYQPDDYRLSLLQNIEENKQIMIADFVKDSTKIDDAVVLSEAQGFIAFPRSKNNYYYTNIPEFIPHENMDDIHQLNQAKNYLYLINPSKFSTKDSLVTAIQSTNYDLIILDLFFNGMMLTPADIESLKTKENGGDRLVIAYMNIGAAENYRYYWQQQWQLHLPSWLIKPYDDYQDEYWVAYWHPAWQGIIYGSESSYLDKILQAGFDGVYLDNVEAYYFLFEEE